jgi:hypothetical protein
MPRWRRRASNMLCAISLIVLIVAAMFWIRGYFAHDTLAVWRWFAPDPQNPALLRQVSYGLQLGRGEIGFSRYRVDVQNARLKPGLGWQYYQTPSRSLIELPTLVDRFRVQFAGFQLRHVVFQSGKASTSGVDVVLPSWVCIPFAIPPVLWLRRRKREHARGFEVTATAAAAPNPPTAD